MSDSLSMAVESGTNIVIVGDFEPAGLVVDRFHSLCVCVSPVWCCRTSCQTTNKKEMRMPLWCAIEGEKNLPALTN